MAAKPEISIVVPVFNEEKNISVIYSRLTAVLKPLKLPYEIILVDDGSTDHSLEIAAGLNQDDSHLKTVSFSRNFGHMAALSAGLDLAEGNAVITLDADLPHPPELIPKLLERWKEGADVVNMIRKEIGEVNLFKVFTAKLFYWLIRKTGRINLPYGSADYRLLDRKVVDHLRQIHEHSRFLRGLISWVGFRQASVEYEADPRYAGQSKYSLAKMISFALDGITSFSSTPLRLSTYLGLTVALLSFLYIIYAVYVRLFTSRAIEGWASVLVTVLFIGGVQLIFLGIIGEYLSRVYDETKARPLYIIASKIGF